MRTVRLLVAATIAAAALSGCFFIIDNTSPTVTLEADSTVILAGDRVAIVARAYDPQGDLLSYEWYDDGELIAGETGSTLFYWRAVESTVYPTVSVVVSDGHGGYDTDSISFTVEPRYGGVIVVQNLSNEDVWYFKEKLSSNTKWSADRLGSYIIPAGSSYPIVPDDAYGYYGYAYQTWDLRAIPSGQDEYSPVTYWQQDGVAMYPYDVFLFTLQ